MCKKYSMLTPEFKREVQKSFRSFNRDMVWYVCEVVNESFMMKYPHIHETTHTKKEYVRLYFQYLWRWIADNGDQDYTKALESLDNWLCKK